MLKVGVVGLGMMGQHHVRVYKELGCDVVGIADASPERAKEIGEKYHIPYYSDYHELIGSVEAISIAVPTSLHRNVALDFINSGVHCLVEKPIASTLEEAEDIVTAAEAHKVKVLIGHIERFNPAVQGLKQIMNTDTLGDIISFSAKRVGPHNPRIRDVGIIIDLATHDIDVMRYLCPSPLLSVYATANSFLHTHEDHAVITLRFAQNIAGVIETNWLTPYKMRHLTVIGTNGVAELDYINATLKIYNQEGVGDIEIIRQEPLKLELSHFLKCVTAGEMPLVTVADGMAVLSIALAATESARNNNVIIMKPV